MPPFLRTERDWKVFREVKAEEQGFLIIGLKRLYQKGYIEAIPGRSGRRGSVGWIGTRAWRPW